jgi:hypothetical protein
MQNARAMVAGVATLMCSTVACAHQHFAPAFLDDARPVDVWLSHHEYRPFEKAQVGFVGPAGSYLLVMRIADDGYGVRGRNTIEILYPRPASAEQLLFADNPGALGAEFKTLGGPGTTGAVFAVAASKAFDLSNVPERFSWESRQLPGVLMENRQDIAGRVIEKLGITPADILGVAVDAYDVVKAYGNAARQPLRSQLDLSTDIFRRCEAGSSDKWCQSFKR